MWRAASGTQTFHLFIWQHVQVALYYPTMFTAQSKTHTHTARERKRGGSYRQLHTNTSSYCCNPIRLGSAASYGLWGVNTNCDNMKYGEIHSWKKCERCRMKSKLFSWYDKLLTCSDPTLSHWNYSNRPLHSLVELQNNSSSAFTSKWGQQ